MVAMLTYRLDHARRARHPATLAAVEAALARAQAAGGRGVLAATRTRPSSRPRRWPRSRSGSSSARRAWWRCRVEKKARHLVALPACRRWWRRGCWWPITSTHQRPMMGSFLDALGIAHEDGLIADEETSRRRRRRRCARPPQRSRRPYPPEDVALYLSTLHLAGPRDLGRAGRRCPRRAPRPSPPESGVSSLIVRMDDERRGLDRAPHADGARDRPRHRQHRLHLDPRREAAPEDRERARKLGLSLAMFIRIALLLSITWVMGLTAPLFTRARPRDLRPRPDPARRRPVPDRQEHARDPRQAGRARRATAARRAAASFAGVIVQILLLDIVFSLDSVITAVGMAERRGRHDRWPWSSPWRDAGVVGRDQRVRRAPSDREDAGAQLPAADRRVADRRRASTSTSRRATSTSRWASRCSSR